MIKLNTILISLGITTLITIVLLFFIKRDRSEKVFNYFRTKGIRNIILFSVLGFACYLAYSFFMLNYFKTARDLSLYLLFKSTYRTLEQILIIAFFVNLGLTWISFSLKEKQNHIKQNETEIV